MRRHIALLTALGLLGTSVGCSALSWLTITTGRCDCAGIPDPCGGPPLPIQPVGFHGPAAPVDGALPATAPPAPVVQPGPAGLTEGNGSPQGGGVIVKPPVPMKQPGGGTIPPMEE